MNVRFLIGLLLLSACVEAQDEDGRDWVDPNLDALETVEQAAINCSERADTGYVRGDAFRITVVTVDSKPVERETANAYYVMQQAAQRDGVAIRIVSGFRTQDEQRYLYGCYTNCNCNNCNLAARPGYSNHQSGHALDLNTSDGNVARWLNNNGARFGFRRTVPSELWHWEWWGGGPGGGPCGGAPCQVVGVDGGVLDDGGSCFQAMGPANLWREVEGVGRRGGHGWTHAWVSDEPSNWGQWNIHLERGGQYEIAVATAGGVWPQTRYKVRHDGQTATRRVDQSLDGWQTLGHFQFARGGEQWVKVFDNYDGPVGDGQRVVADAVRIRPWVEPCVIEPDGSRVDDGAGCVQFFGPAETWRSANEGVGGALRWTNAFEADDPANWARWNLRFVQAGQHEVEVATGGQFGVWPETRYRVGHSGAWATRTLDQSLDGWQSLGVFDFAQGDDQSVAVYDNYDGRVDADQHIAVDAIRLRPWVDEPDPDDPGDPLVPGDEEDLGDPGDGHPDDEDPVGPGAQDPGADEDPWTPGEDQASNAAQPDDGLQELGPVQTRTGLAACSTGIRARGVGDLLRLGRRR